MEVLIVTAQLPYPTHTGGAIRTFGLIHGLAQQGHKITLLTFDDGGGQAASNTPLAASCDQIITLPTPARSKQNRLRDLLLSRQPDIAQRFYSMSLWNKLRELLSTRSFDLVQFESIEMARYLLLARQFGTRAKLAYDAFNLEYDMQRIIYQVDRGDISRWHIAAYSLLQIGRIKQFERELCRTADFVIAVSPEDGRGLRALDPQAKVYIVPNGIFVNDYTNDEQTLSLGEQALVFTGKMDYRPNVDAMLWFTDHIFPPVRKRCADATLYIVGQKPHERLNSLRSRAGIQISGWVPHVQPYLNAAAVYVAPLRMGSGTRLKILEAMASGCAVVATTVAASGLLPEIRKHMIIADDAPTFSKAILALLHDPEGRQQLGTAARQAIREYYDWSVLLPRLLDAYKDIGLG